MCSLAGIRKIKISPPFKNSSVSDSNNSNIN
jgi:hypothetical protein